MPVTSVTVQGISADVLVDGYRKGIVQGEGPWREVVYILPWDDSDAFMDALMGYASASPGPGLPIVYGVPHAYPGNDRLYCMEVNAEPIGAGQPAPDALDSNGLIDASLSKLFSSDWAKVTARYQASRIDFQGIETATAFGGQPVPWSTDNIRGYVQTYPIPAGVIKAEGTDEPNDKPFELRVNEEEWTRKRYMQDYLYTDLARSLGGTVNSKPIWGNPIGTMLLQPFDANSGLQTDGSRSSELSMSWLFRPIDRNKKLSKVGTDIAWVRQVDGSGNYPYPYADHTPLTLA
jgi:hypothetical protein